MNIKSSSLLGGIVTVVVAIIVAAILYPVLVAVGAPVWLAGGVSFLVIGLGIFLAYVNKVQTAQSAELFGKAGEELFGKNNPFK